MPVSFTEDGDIQSLTIYHNGGTGHVLLGVYSDATGAPLSLLGITSSTTVNATEGWQTVNLTSPVSVTTGQTVWLAYVFENSVGIRYEVGTPGRALSSDTWTSGMPGTFGVSTNADYNYSLYLPMPPEGEKL